MKYKYRVEVLRAMELLARAVNNEENIESWLMCGVADGDITEQTTDEELLDYVEDDSTFADVMGCFLKVMSNAKKDGGLYVDGVVSKGE